MRPPEHTLTFRPRIQLDSDAVRPTRADISLDAISHNLAVLKRLAAPAQVMAVVKADAYGHGVAPVAFRLEDDGVDAFGVALAEEALELRDAGIHAPILVLNGVYAKAHREVLERGLTPVVYDEEQIALFHQAVTDRPFRVHLKIDTGMARLGVQLDSLSDFLTTLERYPRCVIAGLLTHLSSADSDAETTAEQLRIFDQARAMVFARGHAPTSIHVANSAATLRFPEARFDMVRPGGALYGVVLGGSADDVGLRTAMTLRSEVIALRRIKVGTRVGYDGTYQARRAMTVATIPVGYGDGLLRALSSRGSMVIRGQKVPIVGRVSMDLTMLDVTDVEGVSVHDEVVVFGEQEWNGKRARVTAQELAELADTIEYDVLTSISRRVPRAYKD